MSLKPVSVCITIIALFLGACTTNPVEESDQTTVLYPAKEPVQASTDSITVTKPVINTTDRGQTDITENNFQYQDVWQRIRHKLQLKPDPTNSRINAKVSFYASKQDYLDRVAERALPYLFYIVEELEKRDMPLALALLPIVESAYQPFAYSRSHASGIWQFIPSTGKHYGLKQNWWYDGRRDIVASTNAALTYLERLHGYFDGDWLLAIAAYNAGERTIKRAINSNIKAGKATDFWSLKLRRETMHYVPSLLAVAEIVAHPEKYHISLKPVPNKQFFDIVDVGSQIDLGLVSELTGLSDKEIQILNPGLKKWATDPEGPHYLLLPISSASSFQQEIASIPVTDRVKWHVHHIRQGDNLGKIAQRYNTDVHALKQANNLNSNLIRAGHSLLIPVPGLSTVSSQSTTLKQPAFRDRIQYTIKPGDTLWKISRRMNTSIEQICDWNDITPDSILSLGDLLIIYAVPPGRLQVATGSDESTSQRVSYTVKSGDSLWLIARRFDVTIEEILDWNRLHQQTNLKPGQNLDIFIAYPADA